MQTPQHTNIPSLPDEVYKLLFYIIIIPPDYVMVMQEHGVVNVSENEVSVKVCGVLNTTNIIDCAVNYNFHVSLNLIDIDAGRNGKKLQILYF